jgi:hypothetical protein
MQFFHVDFDTAVTKDDFERQLATSTRSMERLCGADGSVNSRGGGAGSGGEQKSAAGGKGFGGSARGAEGVGGGGAGGGGSGAKPASGGFGFNKGAGGGGCLFGAKPGGSSFGDTVPKKHTGKPLGGNGLYYEDFPPPRRGRQWRIGCYSGSCCCNAPQLCWCSRGGRVGRRSRRREGGDRTRPY